MKKLIVLLLLFAQVASADQSTFLEKGTAAPYDGFLLDREKAGKIRLLDIDYQEALKTNTYLKSNNEIYAKRLDNMTQANDDLAHKLVGERSSGIWSKLGFFILGTVLTTAVVFGVSRVSRP